MKQYQIVNMLLLSETTMQGKQSSDGHNIHLSLRLTWAASKADSGSFKHGNVSACWVHAKA